MKNKINIIIVAASIVFLITYVFWVDGVDNIINLLLSVSKGWLFVAFLMIVIYWLLEAIILHIITKHFYPKQKFGNTIHTSMVGQLFNCLTPFSSGGQPMQAFDMKRYGIPIGTATCSLLVKFIVYQFALTILSTIVLILKFNYFTSQVSGFVYLVIVGFLVNFAVLAFLISIGFFKGFTTKCTNTIIRLLAKIHIIKRKEYRLEQAQEEINRLYEGFQQIKKNKSLFFINFFLSALQIVVFSAIPYFIYLAFGLHVESFLTIVCAQVFVSLITAFVPLPGAIGGAEVSFFMFFEIFFQGNVNTAILLWRLITFYSPIIVGLIFYAKCKKLPDSEGSTKK